jgi:YaiO family outer membrane protein
VRTINQLTFIIGIGFSFSLVVANKSVAADTYALNGVNRFSIYNPQTTPPKMSHDAIKVQNERDLIVLDQKLQKNPRDVKSLYQKALIYADQEKYNSATLMLDKVKEIDPHYAPANALRATLQNKIPDNAYGKYKNKLGFDWNEAYITDLEHYWSYASLSYYRLTHAGTFGARVNYSHRLGHREKQYQVEAYPTLTPDVSLAINYAYADPDQSLYPVYHYLVEGYFHLTPAVDWSAGQRFINFQGHNIYTYTGSIGRTIEDNYLWARPYFYNAGDSKYYEFGIKHFFFDNSNTYISFKTGFGKVPDIGDLEPLDSIVIFDTTAYNIDGQYQICDDLLLRGGIGYAKQVFPSGSIRRVKDFSLGVSWLF